MSEDLAANVAIGVAYTGDAADQTARSGTPYGVLHGVRANGFNSVALKATPGRQLDRFVAAADAVVHAVQDPSRHRDMPSLKRAYQGAHLGRATSVVRTFALSQRRSWRQVDGIIALGTGYKLSGRVPYVVYDDMTIIQAIEAGYPEWRSMRETDRRFRISQQRERYIAAKACCMTTEWAARSVHSEYGVPAERIFVVGAGTHEEPRDVCRDYAVPRMLFIGLNWERKNGDRVLEGFGKVRKIYPEATLDIVGRHPQIVQDGVRCHGRLYRDRPADLQALNALYDQATCFVMPSVHEPGGVVFVEAASVGLGAVAGNNGGSVDFVGDAGLIVDPLDQAAVTSAMLQISIPAVARDLGERASKRVGLFTWEAVGARLLSSLGYQTGH